MAEGGIEQEATTSSERCFTGKGGAVVGRQALQRIFQLLKEPVVIDSQDGDRQEDVFTRVIAQILHRVLASAPPGTDDALVITDERLELLQDLLEKPRPPLKRKVNTPPTTPGGDKSIQGEHVIKFMRRQADYDALRVAAGVMFTVAGVIKESPEYRNESLLLGEVAGEIHNIGRRLCGVSGQRMKRQSESSTSRKKKRKPARRH